MKLKYTWSWILLLIFPIWLTAQKYEREDRLDENQVPAKAKAFIAQANLSAAPRWYLETGLQRKSIEAKTTHQGKKYSIEFDEKGNFEDLEIKIKRKEIATDTRCAIHEYLENKYSKHKIYKIQIHYTGASENILAWLNGEEEIKDFKYEIVLKGKKIEDADYEKAEYMFSGTGAFLDRNTIIENNYDHLEY